MKSGEYELYINMLSSMRSKTLELTTSYLKLFSAPNICFKFSKFETSFEFFE